MGFPVNLIWSSPKRSLDCALVGQLPSPAALGSSLVVANRTNALWEDVPCRGSRAAKSMPTSISSITAGVAFASPDERRGMSIPAFNGLSKPVFEDFHIIDMVSLQCSSFDDALDRLG